MKRFDSVVLGCVSVVLAVTTACGSADSGEPVPSTAGDPVSITASAQTTSELGVVSWRAGLDNEGTTIIRGYSASAGQVIEFRQRVSVPDPEHRVVEISVTGGRVNGVMRTAVSRGPDAPSGAHTLDVRVDENTFVDQGAARRVLDLLNADTVANGAKASSSGGGAGTSLTTSLHPSDITLVNGYCTDLNPVCTAKLVISVGSVVAAAHGCGLTVAQTAIALICDIATAETAVGPLACTAAAAPGVAASAAECALGVAGTVDGADGVREKCLKKCDAK